ncbi:MAG TPA: amidohydrolase family protein [Pseudolabrys sp.]
MNGTLDGGVFLGRDARTGIGFDAVQDLLARLDAFSIDQALAHDFSGILYDCHAGNARTKEVCAASRDRLLPVATININGWDPRADPIESLSESFRVIALHASWQGWSWSSVAVERLAAHAKAAGIALQPTIIAAGELSAAARALCPSGARVLFRMLGRGGYNFIPEYLAIAEKWPNAFFDVSTITQTGGIAYLAERIGADRLYFASGSPVTLEGAPLFTTWAADIDDRQRALIAGGTLRRVLSIGGETRVVRPAASFDKLRRLPKADTHSHTGTWNIIEPSISDKSIRNELDCNNTKALIVNSIQSLNGDLEGGNARLARFIETDPRLFGLIVIDPTRPEHSLAEIERYKGHRKFVGLKTIQDFYEKDMRPLRLDDAAYTPMWKAAAAERLPVMAHIPGMPEAARTNPNVTFICAHSTWRYRDFAGLNNVYFDIATSTNLRSECDLRGLIDTVGAGRVIFSSDSQLMTTAFTLGKLASVPLADTELEQILWRNAFLAFPRLALPAAAAA